MQSSHSANGGTHQFANSSGARVKPRVIRYGEVLLGTCITFLGAGGTFVHIFFPEQIGSGLDGWKLGMLIPIWTIGIIGILLLLAGWIVYPTLDTQLNSDLPLYPDGRRLSPFTRVLATITICISLLPMVFVCYAPDQPLSPLGRFALAYIVTTLSCFLIYALNFYCESKHRATTTYMNLFGPLVAVVLSPITLPFLIGLNWRDGYRRSS